MTPGRRGPRQQHYHPPPRPTKAQQAAHMRAMAAQRGPEAVERIEAFLQRSQPSPVAEQIATPVPGTNTNTGTAAVTKARRKGVAVEGVYGGKGVVAVLEQAGYTIAPNRSTYGAADVIAYRARLDVVGPPIRAVQAKRTAVYKPSLLNSAIWRFVGLERGKPRFDLADGTREAWLWLDRHGWILMASLDAHDGLTVAPIGKGTREQADATRREIERSVARRRAALSVKEQGTGNIGQRT